MDNSVTLVGNVTRDPELRYTPAGQPVVQFGMAVNRRWQNRQTQEWEEEASFFDCVIWQQLAENVAESIAKGNRVIVTGDLRQRSWETPEGDKRSKVEVNVTAIGAELRFATCSIVKNAPKGGTRAPHPADAGGDQPPLADGGGSPFEDEEPF